MYSWPKFKGKPRKSRDQINPNGSHYIEITNSILFMRNFLLFSFFSYLRNVKHAILKQS